MSSLLSSSRSSTIPQSVMFCCIEVVFAWLFARLAHASSHLKFKIGALAGVRARKRAREKELLYSKGTGITKVTGITIIPLLLLKSRGTFQTLINNKVFQCAMIRMCMLS